MKITIEGNTAEIVILFQELTKKESAGKGITLDFGNAVLKKIPAELMPTDNESEKSEKPKKEWTDKQKADIQSIKDAVEKRKAEKNIKGGGKHNFRKDIDDSLIVYMRDEQGKTIKEIAKEIGCCQQTVLNRYNRAKRNAEKGGAK